jgi:hypothetical protein
MRLLYRQHRKVWSSARDHINGLKANAVVGDACHPPLEPGVRRKHFYRDRYRLVWRVVGNDEDGRIDILAVALKTDDLYHRVESRLLELVDAEREALEKQAGRLLKRKPPTSPGPHSERSPEDPPDSASLPASFRP